MKTTDNLKFTGEDVLAINKDRQQEAVAHQGGNGVETGSKNGLCPGALTRKSTAIAAALAAYVPLASVGAEVEPVGKAATTAEATIQFDIPAQDLSRALSDFTAQSHVQVLYEGDIAKGLFSAPIKGAYTPKTALNMLLAATPVQARFTGARTVTFEPRPTPVPSGSDAGDAVSLGIVTVSATAADGYDSNDPYNPDYSRPNAITATKTDTPLIETPVSVQVVPRAVMDDQQASTFRDALQNVSGVRPQTSNGRGTGILIRGFRDRKAFRNGLLANRTDFDSEYDAANLQSVEVLKGPASVLFGRAEPGGLINLVTKRPLDTPYYSLEQRFGSYDFYRTQWDATGPVVDDKSLLYRFTGSYQDSNSFRDFNFTDRFLVNPSITWRPSDRTQMTLEVEGFNQDYQADRGLFAIGDRPAPIPISRSFIDPNDPVDNISKVHVGFDLTHAFNDSWTLRNRFLASLVHTDDFSVKPANAFVVAAFRDPSAGNRIYQRNIFKQVADSENYATNLDLVGNFDIWSTKHETLVGFDYLRARTKYHTKGNPAAPTPGLEIDIYNPDYGIDPSFYTAALSVNFPVDRNYAVFEDEWFGVYFQDHITLWDKLHIVGGGRHDWATISQGRGGSFDAANRALNNASPAPFGTRKDEQFSPRVGILYQPWPWLSVYGNWTTSFGLNNGITAGDKPLPPESAEQYEAGIKGELFDQRLIATLAYYHLTKSNILTPDLTTPDPNDQSAIGKARSQGIELDISGRITESLSLIGSYAYTDAKITKDNTANLYKPGTTLEGNRLTNVPEHSGSLWLKYDVHGIDTLEGLSLGIGVFAVDQRNGDNENSFKLPGFARLDASAEYRWKIGPSRLTAQFNVRNLLDKTYYDSTDPFNNAPPRAGIYPGAPLTFIGSVRLQY